MSSTSISTRPAFATTIPISGHPPSFVHGPYGYTPTEFVAIIFVVLFSLSMIAHLIQASFYRKWWLIPTAVVAGLLEVLGWGARLWSSKSPFLLRPYEMQLATTILAPTFFVAANFIILKQIITILGASYSRLQPNMYAIIFLICDSVALVVQAVGGGLAAGAVGMRKNPTPGGHIMLGGIVFQMAAIIVYVFCAVEFFVRYLRDLPLSSKKATARGHMDGKMKLMCLGLAFSTLCLFIRAVYRTIELSDGWNGRIITTQVYFNVLDGTMIVLAIVTMNFAHPGRLLKDATTSENSSVVEPKETL